MKEVQAFSIADYLVQAAGIPHPWRAVQYRVDEVAMIVHLWITRQPRSNVAKKRSWFNFSPAESAPEVPASGPEMQWRHLNCMNFSCQVHTTDALDERHFDLPWFGQPGLPFSNRLSRQIFHGMLVHQAKLEQKQAFLFRLVDIGNELFAMAASASRAQAWRCTPSAMCSTSPSTTCGSSSMPWTMAR